MLAVWKREVQNYFLTPIGYVFMGIFLLVGGFFFFMGNIMNGSSDVTMLFGNLSYMFMILVPILTMRLLSEDRRNKTDQLLLTSPATIHGIVLGKFLAACTVLFAAMVISLFYIVVIMTYLEVSPFTPAASFTGGIITNYVGFFLLGCSYIAIGVLMSALTESQVSAAVLTFGVNLFLQIFESVGPQLNIPYLTFLPTVFSWMSLYTRYASFTAGVLSIGDVLYFASFCGIILFLAVRVIDKRRWSEG